MFFKLDKKLQNHIEGFSHLGETLRFDGEIDCKGEIEIAGKVKGILTVEMNAGQMVEDVRLAVNGKVKVDFYGRMGGMIPSPEEITRALKNQLIGG